MDLYHFQISGPGRYAMLAEVFAGRIGSPLDPGISLYELDPSTGQLVFLAGNNNTLNPTQGTDGSVPLFTDSALTAGLTAGDYYLAVADGSNTPSPLEGQMPGSPGIFDPNQPGSAQNGWSTGPYLLNLLVQPAPDPPRVRGLVAVAAARSSTRPPRRSPCSSRSRSTSSSSLTRPSRRPTRRRSPRSSSRGADGTKYYAAIPRLTTARRTRPRSRCSTACRTARTPCTSRAREA